MDLEDSAAEAAQASLQGLQDSGGPTPTLGGGDRLKGLLEVPSYTVFDVFASYRFNRNLSARVNVGNVFDRAYYLAAYRSGAFTYIGDGRNAQVTAKYEF